MKKTENNLLKKVSKANDQLAIAFVADKRKKVILQLEVKFLGDIEFLKGKKYRKKIVFYSNETNLQKNLVNIFTGFFFQIQFPCIIIKSEII